MRRWPKAVFPCRRLKAKNRFFSLRLLGNKKQNGLIYQVVLFCYGTTCPGPGTSGWSYGRYLRKNEVDGQDHAEESGEVVPAQGVGLHEDEREDREDREGDNLLDDLQLPDREGTFRIRPNRCGWPEPEKQYSNRAMPQLKSTMAISPKRSSLDLNAMCPYQASVMKALEMTSSATVDIPRNISG